MKATGRRNTNNEVSESRRYVVALAKRKVEGESIDEGRLCGGVHDARLWN